MLSLKLRTPDAEIVFPQVATTFKRTYKIALAMWKALPQGEDSPQWSIQIFDAGGPLFEITYDTSRWLPSA